MKVSALRTALERAKDEDEVLILDPEGGGLLGLARACTISLESESITLGYDLVGKFKAGAFAVVLEAEDRP